VQRPAWIVLGSPRFGARDSVMDADDESKIKILMIFAFAEIL